MSLYADYIKERMGDEIVELPEGFASYRYIDDNGYKAVYIVDIYVKPDFRKTRTASEMADFIAREAKEKGCGVMIGTVATGAKDPTSSIKVLLGYGMKFYKSNETTLIFRKEI